MSPKSYSSTEFSWALQPTISCQNIYTWLWFSYMHCKLNIQHKLPSFTNVFFLLSYFQAKDLSVIFNFSYLIPDIRQLASLGKYLQNFSHSSVYTPEAAHSGPAQKSLPTSLLTIPLSPSSMLTAHATYWSQSNFTGYSSYRVTTSKASF